GRRGRGSGASLQILQQFLAQTVEVTVGGADVPAGQQPGDDDDAAGDRNADAQLLAAEQRGVQPAGGEGHHQHEQVVAAEDGAGEAPGQTRAAPDQLLEARVGADLRIALGVGRALGHAKFLVVFVERGQNLPVDRHGPVAGRGVDGGWSAYRALAMSRSTYFWILPVLVFGSWVKTTVLGTLKPARCSRQKATMSAWVTSWWSALRVMKAQGVSPHFSSGRATTAASSTPWWRYSTPSTSMV